MASLWNLHSAWMPNPRQTNAFGERSSGVSAEIGSEKPGDSRNGNQDCIEEEEMDRER
jgi:hypothetical protein